MDQLLLPEVIQTSLVSMQYHQSSLTTYTSDFSGQLLLGDLMGPSYEQLLHPVQNVASVQVQNEITLQDFMSDIWPSAFEQTQGHQHDQVLLEQQGQVLLEQYNQVLSENHNQNVLERHKTGSKVMTTDLQIQQIPTSEKWIQWQAFAVHRMLSGLSHEPLPPHKFSAGWLWSFKKRNQLKQVALNKKAAVNDVSLEILTLRSLLDEYTMDDIYFCDVTSIFALPDGTAKHEPVMLDRLFQTSPGLRRKSFANWLVAFNDKLERNVLLLVSIAIWEQIKDKLQGLMLTRVRVEAVPAQLNAWLPMRTGVAREFKAYINAINFEWTLGVNSIEGSVYKAAMQEIQASVIQQCFGRFKEAVQGQEPTEMSKTLTPAQLRLKRVLTNAHGKKPDGTADNSNKGVFEYYLNQDGDIGPNAFLCTEIQMMLSNSDTQGFLDASGYSTRPVREWWNFIVTNS
ncbi:hypothetical protein FBU30_007313 [Linnemannia zychae]|nr:hypothetical protein FBU30_007313 [Linnemannia zychae]